MAIGQAIQPQHRGCHVGSGVRFHCRNQVLDKPMGCQGRVTLQVHDQIRIKTGILHRLGAAFGAIATGR